MPDPRSVLCALLVACAPRLALARADSEPTPPVSRPQEPRAAAAVGGAGAPAPPGPAAPARPRLDADGPFASATRLALEGLGGVIGGALFGLAGAGAYAVLEPDPGDGHCDACGLDAYGYVAFAAAGAIIGLPLGVHAAGEWSGVDGSLGATYLGELGGLALAGIVGGSLHALDAERPAAAVLVVSPLFALAGALVGRELTTRGGASSTAGASARLRVSAGSAGAALVLQGAF